MPESELRLVRRRAEFISRDHLNELPKKLRGFYVLYRELPKSVGGRKKYEVLYIGMATAGQRGGIHGRLTAHKNSKRKGDLWTHFSAFEVWDNIRHDEIAEIEGLFRHIYRKDPKANRLNIQRGFKKARKLPLIFESKAKGRS